MPISALWILILAVALPHAAETVFSPAVLNIKAAFNATSHEAQWTISTYLTGYTLGTIIWGPVADKYGQKATLTWALLGFSITSLLCAAATNLITLFAFRFISGAFGAVSSIVPQAYLLKYHSTQERAIISAKIGQAIAIGPAIGPSIGLYFLSHGPWQFLIIPIGVASCLLTALIHKKLINDQPEPHPKTSFNPWRAFKKIAPYSLIMGLSISTGFYFFAESRFFFTHHLKQGDVFYQMACWSIAICWFIGPYIAERLLKRNLLPLVILQYGAFLSFSSALLLLISLILVTQPATLSIISMVLIFLMMVGTGMQIGNSITLALTPFKSHGAKASSVFAFTNYTIASLVVYAAPYFIGSHLLSLGQTYLIITVILLVTSRLII